VTAEKGMNNYKEFTRMLIRHLDSFPKVPRKQWEEIAMHYVNGVAADELRRLISLEQRRASGAFFTEHELAKKVLQHHKFLFDRNPVFYDPSCGTANLLLAAQEIYTKELDNIGLKYELLGTDIHKEFIQASKARLSMNDILLGGSGSNFTFDFLIADGMKDNDFYKKATHIVVNPPFNLIEACKEDIWTSGKVSAAAVFIDRIIKHIRPGTQVVAILPEVLRCGSRYEKWRRQIEKSCKIIGHQQLGQFDEHADIDVFSILLEKREDEESEDAYPWVERASDGQMVEDFFDVSIGPVVDNRDPQRGKKRPYLKSRGLQGWTEVQHWPNFRKHEGRFFTSPFIVIKRTSRVGELNRATAAIINIPEPVYVDNHLIVLSPKTGKLSDCRNLLKVLKEERTDNWINSQIRCRHLTVKAVSKIPI